MSPSNPSTFPSKNPPNITAKFSIKIAFKSFHIADFHQKISSCHRKKSMKSNFNFVDNFFFTQILFPKRVRRQHSPWAWLKLLSNRFFRSFVRASIQPSLKKQLSDLKILFFSTVDVHVFHEIIALFREMIWKFFFSYSHIHNHKKEAFKPRQCRNKNFEMIRWPLRTTKNKNVKEIKNVQISFFGFFPISGRKTFDLMNEEEKGKKKVFNEGSCNSFFP